MTTEVPEPDRGELIRRMNDRELAVARLRVRAERCEQDAKDATNLYRAVYNGACYHCEGRRLIDVSRSDSTAVMRDCDVCGGTGQWP